MFPVTDLRWQAEHILEQLGKKDTLTSHLFELGCNRAREGDWGTASETFEQFFEVSEDLQDFHSIAAAQVGLGACYLCKGYPSRSVEYYRRAAQIFYSLGEGYGRGVVLFGLALIYQAQRGWRQVFRFYQESVEVLKAQNDPLSQQLREEVLRRLEEALQEYERSLIAGTTGGSKGSPASRPAPADSNKDQPSHLLLFMPIVGRIAAGKPIPTEDDIQNYVVTDSVHIDGGDYAIRVLGKGSGRELKLQMEYRYFAMQVRGDSMIGADILEGDYVILKQPRSLPPTAYNGDIVAATITDIEPEATLKRFDYRRGKNRIILRPENPSYETFEFTEGDQRVKIVGIAIAVLKRLERNSP